MVNSKQLIVNIHKTGSPFFFVIPAKAGIQSLKLFPPRRIFTGVTGF